MNSAPAAAPAGSRAAGPVPPASPKLGYQPALDGIRAVAVLAVMIYHSYFTWGVGGYLGVDAFFVLSGFLITNLLLAEWQRRASEHGGRGAIDLSAFYARRIRRLFPALVVMLLGVGLYAAFVAPVAELSIIRGDAFATLGYVGNWRQVAVPHWFFTPSPLQHTWSLAVEEQWYLIWPLVLYGLLMLRLRIRTLLAVVVGGAVASSLLMIVLYRPGVDLARVYNGTDTRAQELLIGTALAVLFVIRGYARTRAGRLAIHLAAAVSVVVVGWAWFAADLASWWVYHGGLGLLAFCVALIISSAIQPGRNPLRAVLSVKPLRWIGLISYGLYLWHWPVYVWLTPGRTGIDDAIELLALRWLVTFSIAAASYYLVEMPIRRQNWRMPRLAVMVAIASVLLVVMFFAVTARSVADPLDALDRVAARSKQPPGAALDSRASVGVPVASPASGGGPLLPVRVSGRTPHVYLTGDSLSLSIGVGMASVARPGEVWNQGAVGCGLGAADLTVPMGSHADGASCEAIRRAWITNSQKWGADVVVLSSEVWDTYDRQTPSGVLRFGTPEYNAWYQTQLQSLVDPLAARGTPVALLTAPCVDTFGLTFHGRGQPWTSFDPTRIPHLDQMLTDFANRNPNTVKLLDLNGYVCPNGAPVPKVNGQDVRSDGVHFTAPGAEWVSKWLLPQLVTTPPG